MNQLTLIALIGTSVLAAGCASTSGNASRQTTQTITLKSPVYFASDTPGNGGGRVYKVNSVQGTSFATLKATDGELWLETKKEPGQFRTITVTSLPATSAQSGRAALAETKPMQNPSRFLRKNKRPHVWNQCAPSNMQDLLSVKAVPNRRGTSLVA